MHDRKGGVAVGDATAGVNRERLGRESLEFATLVAILGALQALGLTAATPLWTYALLGLLATAAITVAYARWPGARGLHQRLALQAPAFLVLVYATGWGPGLVMVLAFLVADAVKHNGARAAWPALGWCTAAVVAGQVAVATDTAPSLVPQPLAHALALLGVLGLFVITSRIATLSSEAEDAKQAEAAAHQRYRSLVQNSSDVVLVLGVDTAVTYASPSVERVLGYDSETLNGRSLGDLLQRDDLSEIDRFIAEIAAQPGETARGEFRLRHADGSWRHVEALGHDVQDDPAVRGLVLNLRDVTERRGLEAQLVHRAFHDELTGLANRALFTDRVAHALARQARRPDGVAVVFCDLDGFKTVNDTLGHAAGDELLVAVAARLADCAREVDTVARLGGDEFAILLEDQPDQSGPARVAQRVLDALAEPFDVRGTPVAVTASIGIAFATTQAQTADDLLRNADIAMYTAKGAGKSRYELFEPSMHVAVVERLRLEADLQQAVAEGQFVLHYQPIVELTSRAITGVEALVRWKHPERGMVSPGEFIPVAEGTGLIVPLGRWVLDEACRQLRTWQQQHPTTPPLHVSVNISARQLAEPSIVEHVRDAIEASGIDADTLTLELTESALVRETEATIARMRDLKQVGVRLAIDDFGTGYSSLSYLQRFPVDTLKIDRSFIDSVDCDASPALLKAIVDIGHTLRLDTVAEGIERLDQADQFRALRCRHGQGFFFARPGDSTTIGALLAGHEWAPLAPACVNSDDRCDSPVS
jgi:diguanylate cyclase (GGDEF)-like protein/PAS domain S-box-containing protein